MDMDSNIQCKIQNNYRFEKLKVIIIRIKCFKCKKSTIIERTLDLSYCLL